MMKYIKLIFKQPACVIKGALFFLGHTYLLLLCFEASQLCYHKNEINIKDKFSLLLCIQAEIGKL